MSSSTLSSNNDNNEPDKLNIDKLELASEEDESWNPWFLESNREVLIEYIGFSEDDRSTVSEGPPERDPQWKDRGEHKEVEYWQIQKLLKFVKAGDQTTTAVALACLADFDYSVTMNQVAFAETGGLEILINILETHDLRCQLGSLNILSRISVSTHVQKVMHNLGAVPVLIKHLCNPNRDLQKFSAFTIMNMAKLRTVRTTVRRKGGIPIMLELVDNETVVMTPLVKMPPDTVEAYYLIRACLIGLSLLAKSVAIRRLLFVSGIMKIIPFLLKTPNMDLYKPGLRTLMLCTSLESVRKALELHQHLKLMMKPLTSEEDEKEELACRLLFKCGLNEIARAQMGKFQLLQALLRLLKRPETAKEEKTLKYCAGAVWRASFDKDNLAAIDEANVVPTLVKFLSHPNVQVRTHVTGCLAELSIFPLNRLTLQRSGGLPPLVSQANKEWDTDLLENIIKTLGNCAESKECVEELQQLDALRIVWSHLDGKSEQLQMNAGLAMVPMLKNYKDIGEVVRSFIGGKEMLMAKLTSHCNAVVAAACESLAEVMVDEENLNIMSELGIVEKLTNLTNTEDDNLRESLAHAIASCSMSSKNASLFGQLGAISPMVGYLASPNLNVVVAAAFALWKLSMEPINCIALHRSGVVPFLLECMGSEDDRLQEAAGGCLNNIRQLAYEADQRSHLMGEIVGKIKRPKQIKPKFSSILLASTVSQL